MKKVSKRIKEIKEFTENGIDVCRNRLTKSIIDLCKETGIDDAYFISFTQTIMLQSTKPNVKKGKRYGFITETTICDQIAWDKHHDFFFVCLNTEFVLSSTYMTLDELSCIYVEMLNVLKKLEKK